MQTTHEHTQTVKKTAFNGAKKKKKNGDCEDDDKLVPSAFQEWQVMLLPLVIASIS